MCLVSGRFCTYPTLCHLTLVYHVENAAVCFTNTETWPSVIHGAVLAIVASVVPYSLVPIS